MAAGGAFMNNAIRNHKTVAFFYGVCALKLCKHTSGGN